MIDGTSARFGTACVLAGGRGRRMEGLDKLRLDFAGERLLARIARQLEARFFDLVAVSSRPEVFEDLGYRVVPDSYTEAGPLAGLHAGLRAARSEWVYLVACDMPFFSAMFVDALVAQIDLALFSGLKPVAAAARSGAFFEPFHAFYHRSLIDTIDTAFATPGRTPSMQSVVQALPVAYLDDCAPYREGPRLFLNVNTPQELIAAERVVSGSALTEAASGSRGVSGL